MKNLCLLGSTGSIGRQTLDIIHRHGGFKITSLAANSNIDLLEQQIDEVGPKKVCVYDKEKAGMIARGINPSAQRNRFSDVRRAQFAACLSSKHRYFPSI